MDTARIPAHLEVSGLLRATEAAGGFATVLSSGERDAGTILVICCHKGTDCCAYERMPQLDGTRKWTPTKRENPDNPFEIFDYWQKRKRQDDDLWVIELDAPDAEKLLN